MSNNVSKHRQTCYITPPSSRNSPTYLILTSGIPETSHSQGGDDHVPSHESLDGHTFFSEFLDRHAFFQGGLV